MIKDLTIRLEKQEAGGWAGWIPNTEIECWCDSRKEALGYLLNQLRESERKEEVCDCELEEIDLSEMFSLDEEDEDIEGMLKDIIMAGFKKSTPDEFKHPEELNPEDFNKITVTYEK